MCVISNHITKRISFEKFRKVPESKWEREWFLGRSQGFLHFLGGAFNFFGPWSGASTFYPSSGWQDFFRPLVIRGLHVISPASLALFFPRMLQNSCICHVYLCWYVMALKFLIWIELNILQVFRPIFYSGLGSYLTLGKEELDFLSMLFYPWTGEVVRIIQLLFRGS